MTDFVLFWSAVSFEIPELPEVQDVTLSAPVTQCLMSQKEKLNRTVSSSSSTASSCSSHHVLLSKTNSTASQDSGGFFLMKSGSVSRSGTSTWASPTAESTTPAQQNTTPSSSSSIDPISFLAPNTFTACSSTANQNPPPPPTATGSVSSPGQTWTPTQRQCSDQGQLEPILEAPPDSPRAFVKLSTPYKRKSKSSEPNENLQVHPKISIYEYFTEIWNILADWLTCEQCCFKTKHLITTAGNAKQAVVC